MADRIYQAARIVYSFLCHASAQHHRTETEALDEEKL
jgi:hypothetical protein